MNEHISVVRGCTTVLHPAIDTKLGAVVNGDTILDYLFLL